MSCILEVEQAIFDILKFLDYRELINISLVSKRFHEWTQSHEIWKLQLQYRFGVTDSASMGKADFIERHLWRRFEQDDTGLSYVETRGLDRDLHKSIKKWSSVVLSPRDAANETDWIEKIYPMDDSILVLTQLSLVSLNLDGKEEWKFRFPAIIADTDSYLQTNNLVVNKTTGTAFVSLSTSFWTHDDSDNGEPEDNQKWFHVFAIDVHACEIACIFAECPQFHCTGHELDALCAINADPSFPDSLLLITASGCLVMFPQSELQTIEKLDIDSLLTQQQQSSETETSDTLSDIKAMRLFEEGDGCELGAECTVDLGILTVFVTTPQKHQKIIRVDLRTWSIIGSHTIGLPSDISMINESVYYLSLCGKLGDNENDTAVVAKVSLLPDEQSTPETLVQPEWSKLLHSFSNQNFASLEGNTAESLQISLLAETRGIRNAQLIPTRGPINFLLCDPVRDWLVVMTHEHVLCLKGKDGTIVWCTELPNSVFDSESYSPAELNADEEYWEMQFWENYYSVIADGAVYILRTSLDNAYSKVHMRLDVLDLLSGQLIPKFGFSENRCVAGECSGGIAVKDGVVYLFDPKSVMAIKATLVVAKKGPPATVKRS